MDADPISATYCTTITEGEVLVDPEGIGWRVSWINGNTIHMERTVVESVPLRTVARKWRKIGEPDA